MVTPYRYIITGHAEHGKDTACDFLLSNFGLKSYSSSLVACELFIYSNLKDRFGYQSFEECYADRRNHRKLWADMISSYTDEHGKHALGEIIFKTVPIYNGIRKIDELNALKSKGYVDFIIWIDASERVPLESTDSMNIPISIADIVISNNTTKEDFFKKLHYIGNLMVSN